MTNNLTSHITHPSTRFAWNFDPRLLLSGSDGDVIFGYGTYRHSTLMSLARIFHESLAATADMDVLPGVLGCRTLRRTVQVRLRSNTLRLPGGTSILTVSRQQFMKYPG